MFGSGSRAPVAITILVKNPERRPTIGCRIRYRDIGDYLNREEKLAVTARSCVDLRVQRLAGQLRPINIYDWIEQRSDAFAQFYPMGSQAAKVGKADDAIFGVVFARVE